MPDAGESGSVQLMILRGPVVDLLLECQFFGWQGDERPSFIDQFTVGFAVRVVADLATLGRVGRFVDVPLGERGGIENVLVSAAYENNRIVRRNPVEIMTEG